MAASSATPKSTTQRFLDAVERMGNFVPHPVIIFLILIGALIIVAAIASLFGASVTMERINPATNAMERETTVVRSLLTVDGIRFLYESLIPNFMSFTAVGLLIGAVMGAGVMEESGLVKALIRKLVLGSPARLLSYFLAFVGILASVAADAGYLVLLPLAGVAFASAGRHPIAGLTLGYAAVAGAFTVNMVIKPLDAVLVQFTNDAIRLIDPAKSISLTANLWFAIASVVFLTILVAVLTDRVVEPRLGPYRNLQDTAADDAQSNELTSEESRGLRYAGLGVLGLIAVFVVLTVPAWAPLRDPQTGQLIGDSPFMNGLIGLIILLFLVSGWCYGIGAGTVRTLSDVIAAMEKAVKDLGGHHSSVLLHRPIHRLLHLYQCGRCGGAQSGEPSQRGQSRAADNTARIHPRRDPHRRLHRRRDPQMGDLRTRVRAGADEARRGAGGCAGRLSHRRLSDESADTDQRLLRPRGRDRPEIPAECGRRHGGGADASLLRLDAGALDDHVRGLVRCRTAVGSVSETAIAQSSTSDFAGESGPWDSLGYCLV